jgi:hypothetical protein
VLCLLARTPCATLHQRGTRVAAAAETFSASENCQAEQQQAADNTPEGHSNNRLWHHNTIALGLLQVRVAELNVRLHLMAAADCDGWHSNLLAVLLTQAVDECVLAAVHSCNPLQPHQSSCG